jgi:hypothetical protein
VLSMLRQTQQCTVTSSILRDLGGTP